MRLVTTWITILAFAWATILTPAISYGQVLELPEDIQGGTISVLNEDDVAPFDGILIDLRSFMTLVQRYNSSNPNWELDMDRALQVQEARFRLEIDLKDARINALADELTYVRTSTQRDIDFLDRQLKLSTSMPDGAWLSIGISLGIGLTLLAGFLWNQASVNTSLP